MSPRHPLFGLFFALALALGLAGAARADIPPMDRCDGAEGSACTNAAPSYTGAGVCTKTTCTRTLPPMGGGQPMQTSYECVLCLAAQRADAGSDGAPQGQDEKKDDGCAYGGRGDAGFTGLALGLAALALLARRRR